MLDLEGLRKHTSIEVIKNVFKISLVGWIIFVNISKNTRGHVNRTKQYKLKIKGLKMGA